MLDFITLTDDQIIQATAALAGEEPHEKTKVCCDCGIEFTPLATLCFERVKRCPECAEIRHHSHNSRYEKPKEYGGEILTCHFVRR